MSAVPLSSDARRARQPSRIPRVRLESNDRYADIIHDRRSLIPIFIVVGQNCGSNEILFMGQFRSVVEAEKAARYFLDASTDDPPCLPPPAVAPIAKDANRHLQLSSYLVDSSRRLNAGGRTLLQRSRELLRSRHLLTFDRET